ncbi:nucleotidyltransferase domain-containing protein [Mycobacterium sp.]|uniref:nucleotidyltransferase domain-containing protein n=1 Tax=Mycobacterium sp. TaxID=1785 RepID=UPI003C71B379
MPDRQISVTAGEAVLAEAVAVCKKDLGERLIAAYALGSLAHGGFSSLVSDVDLGVVLSDPVEQSDNAAIQKVADAVRTGGSDLHERLSIFWGTPAILGGSSTGGRFPPLDRLDLLEHGRLLSGRDVREGIARPSRSELLTVGAEFALDYLGGRRDAQISGSPSLGSMSPGDDSVLAEIRSPALLILRGARRLTKVVLFPVRFLYTAQTGQVGTNAIAVTRYLADPQAPAGELVTAALGWRLAPPTDTSQALALLARDLIPLYMHFIADHQTRLIAAGRSDLAECFEQWRLSLRA